MSDLKKLQRRAMEIANHYDDYNRKIGRKGWDPRDYVEGLVGDVGDLLKAVMAVHDRRDLEKPLDKVEYELNDILWSLLMLFYFFRIPPDKSFMAAMDKLEKRVLLMKEEAK